MNKIQTFTLTDLKRNNDLRREEQKKRLISWLIFLLAAAVLVGLDLLFKSWAAANLQGQPSRTLIPGILGLTYTRNTGAAFGVLANFAFARSFLIIVKIVLMCGILWVYQRIPHEKEYWLVRVPTILIFAGGIGNLHDRIILGYVRDMLRFLFINFPIFNLADVFVVVGCFAGAFVMFFIVKDFP